MRKLMMALAGSLALAFSAAPAAAATSSWQCAPFARVFSGINLFGAAASWWNQAVGKYTQGSSPQLGSVLVFKALNTMRSGHVATVTKIVSDRMIKVTHANWSIIGGRRGQVERDVTVVDASPNNDWSQVKVWYAPIQKVGTKAFPVYGFIYGGKAAAAKVAAVAKDAAEGVGDAVKVVKASVTAKSAAKDSSDPIGDKLASAD
ncbi:CHAP domain-containing protein [Sphingomonas naphthae]|uniref:CHAP domain-containing protein n=1 Tax=Sphingomonas naphthae TaxID=1813468 RepID=A0ABY7THY1_9SPHN|nr:CHAP domain-containing protein [Sphingomonas naphthae]WCT72754.1 CHAP domain-containing protein [Sphingomonas naphthae]